VPGEPGSARRRSRGFVIGELLVAALLLAVAVSSLAALMYSVSHRGEARAAAACVEKTETGPGKCAIPAGGGAKLLRSECGGKKAASGKGCVDSTVYQSKTGAVIVRSKTDSASLALVAKKQRAPRETTRPDRGFIR
jgi:hypothetical protein